MAYRVYSPAKLNLGLQIIGRNQAGMHILNSIFSKISLYDVIDLYITYDDSRILPLDECKLDWAYEEDLIYKAALCLQKYSNVQFGLKFIIRKNIPVGAGLGGGSSNAATVLYYLNILWKLFYSKEILINIAKNLGDDVSFFLQDSSSVYYNFQHSKIRLPKSYFVLIIPKTPLSTKIVFDEVRAKTKQFASKISLSELYTLKNNDLLYYAKILNGNLRDIVDKADKYRISLKMTGSGAVLYLPCKTRELAEFNAKILAKILFGFYNSLKVVKGIEKNPLKCEWI
jgi:4-diphosphocytidyl-2-C-methyl-D-erythritol kinase